MVETTEKTWAFTLVTDRRDLGDGELEDALFEAGFDDAFLHVSGGVLCLDIDRAAPRPEDAVAGTIAQLNSVLPEVVVLRVEPDPMVTLGDAAERLNVSRQHLHNHASGKRGDGSFPQPVARVTSTSPLYAWVEVVTWARDKEGVAEVSDEAITLADALERINANLPALVTLSADEKTDVEEIQSALLCNQDSLLELEQQVGCLLPDKLTLYEDPYKLWDRNLLLDAINHIKNAQDRRKGLFFCYDDANNSVTVRIARFLSGQMTDAQMALTVRAANLGQGVMPMHATASEYGMPQGQRQRSRW
jgi:hypothetical protein